MGFDLFKTFRVTKLSIVPVTRFRVHGSCNTNCQVPHHPRRLYANGVSLLAYVPDLPGSFGELRERSIILIALLSLAIININ